MLSTATTVKYLRILYVCWVLSGMYGIMYVPATLIDPEDPIMTAANIVDHELLFRSGVLVRIIAQLLFIVIPILLFDLFRKTSWILATLMLGLALVSVPMTIHNEIFQLRVLDHTATPDKVMHQLSIYAQGMTLSEIFWGLWLFPLGMLAMRSGYFPKLIGLLVIIAACGYTLSSVIDILLPSLESIKPIMEVLTFGEVIFLLWLVLKGLKLEEVPDK